MCKFVNLSMTSLSCLRCCHNVQSSSAKGGKNCPSKAFSASEVLILTYFSLFARTFILNANIAWMWKFEICSVWICSSGNKMILVMYLGHTKSTQTSSKSTSSISFDKSTNYGVYAILSLIIFFVWRNFGPQSRLVEKLTNETHGFD